VMSTLCATLPAPAQTLMLLNESLST
jgi:hypothetical protein